ncbi:MAG TPA: rubredoxin domain-containing protein [Mucilaginibacter sp.]|nr:rubredoxin domain-containing protein [Mucilaginibacter sp.]
MEHIIKINLPGGYVSAGDLYEILLIAESAGAKEVRFGNRQQLYFTIKNSDLETLEMEMLRVNIAYEVDTDEYANIISSYVCDTIFSNESWLKEGVYRDIFDLFSHQPRLKINLVDQQQTFVPFFSGNLNFISSDISNYWHFYIRFPKSNQFYQWPSLIYSDDIATLSKIAEDVIFGQKEYFFDQQKVNELFFYKMVSSKIPTSLSHRGEPLKLPDFYLPYYEGFNKYSNGNYWLGIYRRNELFPLEFLKDVCSLCIKTRIGQIYTTPWKSIIIKGIEQANRIEWGHILDKYRLNVRHAANELNWQIEDLCEEGLSLKHKLVREFEEADLRTYRLSFAIKTQHKTGLLGSVVIRKQSPGMFDIQHTRDFNPNNKDLIVYKEGLGIEELASNLAELCEYYYSASVKDKVEAGFKQQPKDDDGKSNKRPAYQCKNCLNIYDEQYGDELNNIAAGTRFESIDNYSCSVCDSPKEDFKKVTC